MKLASVIVAILLFSCSKQNDSYNPAILYLNDCNEYINSSENVQLCFNSVVNDSRCPDNAMCIWQGNAVANFAFKKDNVTYPITLSTLAMPPHFIKDTIVAGYKIEFINLFPYPKMHSNPPLNKVKAEVKVTRL